MAWGWVVVDTFDGDPSQTKDPFQTCHPNKPQQSRNNPLPEQAAGSLFDHHASASVLERHKKAYSKSRFPLINNHLRPTFNYFTYPWCLPQS
jgi:hypothetical protein